MLTQKALEKSGSAYDIIYEPCEKNHTCHHNNSIRALQPLIVHLHAYVQHPQSQKQPVVSFLPKRSKQKNVIYVLCSKCKNRNQEDQGIERKKEKTITHQTLN